MNFIDKTEYDLEVRHDWEKLIAGKITESEYVRPEIWHAWKKCLEKGFDPYTLQEPIYLSTEEHDRLLVENRLLCETATPLMKNICKYVPGPENNIILFDKNCFPLVLIEAGEVPTLHDLKYFTNPESMYAEMIDTFICAETKKPFWCCGEENFMAHAKDTMCSSAPILDSTGELAGVLTIATKLENTSWHTFGLAVSSAAAIEQNLERNQAYEEISDLSEQLLAAIESIPEGMIIADSEGTIKQVNLCAKRILYIDTSNTIIGKNLNSIITDESNIFSAPPFPSLSEKEIIFRTSHGFERCYVTIKTFSYETNDLLYLIILREMANAKKIVKNVLSSSAHYSFNDIIGNSDAIKLTLDLAKIASNSTSTVLITGPSGTGKELFAHAIHSASERRDGPFISLNCGALPSGLVESELFGYEEGSFTGAKKNGQIGKFELANGGTIFLDEIGEMPLSVQAAILRVIETKEVVRIGGSRVNRVDVRIIAATNRDLLENVKEKQFREDLYYRLNVLRLCVPPLSERPSDIPLLVDKFLEIYSEKLNKGTVQLSEEAYEMLRAYDWPGNVRELENTIERAVNICPPDGIIPLDYIAPYLNVKPNVNVNVKPYSDIAPAEQMRDVEKNHIIKILTETKGSVTKCADVLGIGRRTLYRKFEEFNIDYQLYRKKR